MNPRAQDSYTQAYNKWVVDQSPENMSELVSAFMPTINSELQQYSGSKDLLRTRAKSYVINAIKTYNPMGNTKLNSWIVTNLKQLSRYGKRLRPIRASEEALRNSAELNRISCELEDRLGRKPTDDELQDETGWSSKEIARMRAAAVATVNSREPEEDEIEQASADPAVSALDNMPFLRDAAYMSLDSRDKDIFDYKLGTHGKKQISGADIAHRLNVSPAYVSQRASAIGSMITNMGN